MRSAMRVVVVDDHAALADREVLVGEEAEAAERAEGAEMAAVELRADGVRGVLEQQQAVPSASARSARVSPGWPP